MTVANTKTLAGSPGSVEGRTTRAVVKGEFITIYCVGLGPVNNPPATGAMTRDAFHNQVARVGHSKRGKWSRNFCGIITRVSGDVPGEFPDS